MRFNFEAPRESSSTLPRATRDPEDDTVRCAF